MKPISLIFLIVMAIMALHTQRLRRAVLFMGLFSLSISFVYLVYQAPDVAIAEAIIGSAFATVLYLVALQKYKVFTVYLIVGNVEDQKEKQQLQYLKKYIETFCAIQELEPIFIYTEMDRKAIVADHEYELIVEVGERNFLLYGHPENMKIDQLQTYIAAIHHGELFLDYHREEDL